MCDANPRYAFINQGNSAKVGTIDDTKEWVVFQKSLKHEGFTGEEMTDLYKVIAAVLHFGQIEFESSGTTGSCVKNSDVLQQLANVLGTTTDQIEDALTHKTLVAHGQTTRGDLDAERAQYACDALSKSLYDRMFTWIVQRINKAIMATDPGSGMTVMGILDIYGFEIMQTNSFEQLCINYCNEKLQQLFIQLTLKAEQDEYKSEGIKWEPIKFFDNKVICDMVEKKHTGIVSVLDNECLRPGEVTDATFLQNLNKALGSHDHYSSWAVSDRKTQRRNSMRRNEARLEFKIMHYAGTVRYSVDGFIDKNNDLLFRDLKELMGNSKNIVANTCFPKSELESRKRPKTAGTQFKESLNALIEILMVSKTQLINQNCAKIWI